MKSALFLALFWALTASTARAQTQGNRLLLERPCGGDGTTVSIVPDPSLSHAVEIDGESGGVATNIDVVKVTGACHGDGALTIRVPPAFPVTINSAASGDIRLGDLLGPLSVQLTGDGDLDAGRLDGGLVLDNAGAGDVSVGELSRSVVLRLVGSGDFTAGRVEANSVSIADSGSSDVRMGGGQIGKLAATSSGSGDLSIAAPVGSGEAVSTGSGDISIARVIGSLVQTQTGSGDIVVHGRGPSSSSPVVVAVPPIPVLPIPAMPRIAFNGEEGSSSNDGGAVVVPVLVLLVGSAGAIVLLRRRRHRRLDGASTDPRVTATADRFEALARRVGRMEALVTSRDFELNRRFREMGD